MRISDWSSDVCSSDLLSEAPTIMSALAKLTASYTAVAAGAKRARMDLRSPAWVPVSARKDAGHTGIIPALGCGAAASLEGLETTVCDLVARRFIMQFFPISDTRVHVYRNSVVEGRSVSV